MLWTSIAVHIKPHLKTVKGNNIRKLLEQRSLFFSIASEIHAVSPFAYGGPGVDSSGATQFAGGLGRLSIAGKERGGTI